MEPIPFIPEDQLPDSLLAGLLEHMACYLQTGRARSIHQARVLLDRIATHPSASHELRECGRHLSEVLEDSLAHHCEAGASPADLRPWLARTWLEVAV